MRKYILYIMALFLLLIGNSYADRIETERINFTNKTYTTLTPTEDTQVVHKAYVDKMGLVNTNYDFSNSIDLGIVSTNYSSIEAMENYNGKLYACTANNWDQGLRGYGTVWSFDGSTWTLDETFPAITVECLKTFNGRIYAGTGNTNTLAYIYASTNGTTWTLDANFVGTFGGTYIGVVALQDYNGLLYAGLSGANDEGDIYSSTGDGTWTLAKDFTGYSRAYRLAKYNGCLFAGMYTNTATGPTTIYKYDGAFWTGYNVGDATTYQVRSLIEYNGYLWAGLAGNNDFDAELWRFDGSTWVKIYEFTANRAESLSGYQGLLYIGTGSATGDGKIYTWDGTNIVKIHEFGVTRIEQVESLRVYNSRLYAGLGRGGDSTSGDAAIWYMSKALAGQFNDGQTSQSYDEGSHNFLRVPSVLGVPMFSANVTNYWYYLNSTNYVMSWADTNAYYFRAMTNGILSTIHTNLMWP